MADLGAVEALLQSLPDDHDRRIHKEVWKRVMRDQRFGRVVPGTAAVNLGGGFFAVTTPATPDTEFSIPHTFGRPPYLLIPMLPLDQVGAKIVPLRTARAADTANIYLSSPTASATLYFYLEG